MAACGRPAAGGRWRQRAARDALSLSPPPRSTPTRTLAAAHGGPPKTRHASAAQRLPPLPSPLTPPRRTSHQIHRKGTSGIPGKAGCVLGRIRPPPNQTSKRQGKHYTKSRRNDVSGVQASHRGALVAQCCGVPHATRPRPHGCSQRSVPESAPARPADAAPTARRVLSRRAAS